MNRNEESILKFNAVKNHKESHQQYPIGSDVEQYVISKGKWTYQANKKDNELNISILTSGERYEFPNEKFKELEYEFFREVWEVTNLEGNSNE